MNILGISAYYHDSAACILKDGEIIAAAQEERFTRKKHDHHFPRQAIGFCLKKANLSVKDIDYVSFYERPRLKFDRLLKTYLMYAPLGKRKILDDTRDSEGNWISRAVDLSGAPSIPCRQCFFSLTI